VYQLYVRSWRDSDGDGFGDLPGVIDKLDYLAWLGVDAVWLSPAMPSPDHDWGYDVSDYMSVHPQLGSLADLDRLVTEADRRQMRVLLDLVPNHTSDEHPWFVEARGSRDAVHRNWYVWAEPGPDGAPPNNWLDASGERAWSLDAATGQYYLHNFLPSQPDLNWWEPAVHDAFEEIIGFWFDRGVAGFRIDVAHGLYKDAALRDNPPMPAGQLIGGNAGQEQRYSANRPETHAVFRNWRQIAEQYEPGRLLLGETCVPEVERLARYYGQGDELQLAFNFPFMVSGFTAPELSQSCARPSASCPPGPFRSGRCRITTSRVLRPAGAPETTPRRRSRSVSFSHCPARSSSTTATRSG
jgi:alpha-glucosidase